MKSSASHSGKESVHSPSIKINENLQLVIPTEEITNSSEYKLFNEHKKIIENTTNKKTLRIIENIIAEYQMLIIANWYTDNSKVENIIKDFIQTDIKRLKLSKTPKYKTQKELDQDKIDIVNYIKKKLNDNNFTVKFSSDKNNERG